MNPPSGGRYFFIKSLVKKKRREERGSPYLTPLKHLKYPLGESSVSPEILTE